jgi:hypothetical protein
MDKERVMTDEESGESGPSSASSEVADQIERQCPSTCSTEDEVLKICCAHRCIYVDGHCSRPYTNYKHKCVNNHEWDCER